MGQVTTTEVQTPKTPASGLLRSLSRIGPSFVSMTTTFGPASLLLAGTAGALYRYQLVWVLPLILLMRIVFYDLGVRVGINIPHNIWTTVGKLWGFRLAAATGVLAFLSSAFYAAGNVLGTASAVQLLTGGNIVVLGIIVMAAAILMFCFRGVYERIEKVALLLVAVMLFSFIGTLAITGWSGGEFIRGLIPRSPSSAQLLLALAIFATNYGGAGTGHTYFVRAKKYTAAETRTAFVDHVLASIMMVVIIGSIMSVGAEVLNPAHLVPKDAPGFVKMLEPLAGTGAKYLFALGLFGAAFTSLVGQPITVGFNLVDGLQRAERGTESPFLKQVAIGMILVLGLWGVIPVALGYPMMNIYWICSLATVVALPLTGTLMLLVARRKDIMKELPLSTVHYVVLWVLFICMVVYSVYSSLRSLGVL